MEYYSTEDKSHLRKFLEFVQRPVKGMMCHAVKRPIMAFEGRADGPETVQSSPPMTCLPES